ncbi:MAG: NAD(P)-dependent alcohol dehydrogenase [Candidatus Dormibacterales bacterium]
MRAIVQDRYGSPDVLRLTETSKPVAGPGEVLVSVRAASVNVADWLSMLGRPYMVRMAFGGMRKPKSGARGSDFAGVVEAVGREVTRTQPGAEVYGWGPGALADYLCCAEANVAPKPKGLTFEQAAAVPLTACTAFTNLRDVARVRPGQKVLINGASGGVGTFAVQVAKEFGADATGVCSTRNVELVRSIGAGQVIDYTKDDFTRTGQRFDLILDNEMNHSLSDLSRVLAPGGILLLNNGTGGGPWFGTLGRMAGTLVTSKFTRRNVRLATLPKRENLPLVTELIEAGKVTPVIDRTYPLTEAAEALRYLGLGHARGKVVITV